MKFLITGGCGFIGRNLIKFLLEETSNSQIRIVDNFSVGKLQDLSYASNNFTQVSSLDAKWEKNKIEVIEGDILDADLAFRLSSGADVIIHLAANTGVGPSVENPRMDCVTNVTGTFNYLEACRINKIPKFVFASSGAPIGNCTPPIHEEMPCHPVSPYGASKLAGEAYCSAYFNSFGVDTVALRFGNAYGPGSTHKGSVVAKFIRKAMNGENLEIYGNGAQTRDFIFTADIVRAINQAAITNSIGGEVFQIATNRETNVSELTETLVSILKNKGVSGFNVIHGEKRVGDVLRNFSDTTKAQNLLKWASEYDISSGLSTTVDWFISRLKIMQNEE